MVLLVTTPVMHLIAPFHTVPSLAASHCAFTGKALRFSKMMKGFFPKIIEYSNFGSESEADKHVVMLTKAEWKKHYAPESKEAFWGDKAIHGTPSWHIFDSRLRIALRARVKDGDFIGHPFGHAHRDLVADFPLQCHVETGIGYPDAPMGAFRIFESEAWKHWHWGKHGEEHGHGTNKCWTYVIPNYFDLDEWPFQSATDQKHPYVLFMGRLTDTKGAYILADIAQQWVRLYPQSPLHFKFAGQGDWEPLKAALGPAAERADYMGSVQGTARAVLIGGAVASMMPTNFIEPFGGSGIEGMLTGTPLLASDWGAFTETVVPGVNGFRCKTLGDWLAAIDTAPALSRKVVAEHARARYSLKACRAHYERAFTAMADLWRGPGWYSERNTLRLV